MNLENFGAYANGNDNFSTPKMQSPYPSLIKGDGKRKKSKVIKIKETNNEKIELKEIAYGCGCSGTKRTECDNKRRK
jgi:hypothetical protein